MLGWNNGTSVLLAHTGREASRFRGYESGFPSVWTDPISGVAERTGLHSFIGLVQHEAQSFGLTVVDASDDSCADAISTLNYFYPFEYTSGPRRVVPSPIDTFSPGFAPMVHSSK